MKNSNAKWIWINSTAKPNEYAQFEGEFTFDGKTATFKIAAETDYILYINGTRVAFGQFAGYPFQKYYDEIDITPFCKTENNVFSLTVRYEGFNSATHIDDGAGVIFSLTVDGKEKIYSSKNTMGRLDNRYIQHQDRIITVQLGLTSGMQSCAEKAPLSPCVEVEKTYNITARPVKKAELCEFAEAKPIAKNSTIYDLGREEGGYLYLKVKCTKPSDIKIAYGEHIADGNVRYLIGNRNFSLDFKANEGEEEFLQLFVKVAARYLEAFLPKDAEIISIGLIPVLYPLTEKKFKLDGLDKKIYDTCVRTLRLCMNTHYEDCPWREQALYVLDSRNQMLCGYYAFEETEFQRENLVFIAKGTRPDGFLELTYPAVGTPAIPFFSIMYPVTVYEYIKYTGDKTVLKDTMDTMLTIMNNTKARIEKNGLIADFEDPYWNFYEWSEGGSSPRYGDQGGPECKNTHLILNCAYVYSAEFFKELCKMADVEFDLDTDALKKAIVNEFYNEETGIFTLRTDNKALSSQLGNAFALLIGLGDERTAEAVKNDKNLVPATLSMMTFVYDALLKSSKNCKEYILNDIREKYGHMLKEGATSFWETIEGQSAFSNAGSLCHGWSAVPVYYYNILK